MTDRQDRLLLRELSNPPPTKEIPATPILLRPHPDSTKVAAHPSMSSSSSSSVNPTQHPNLATGQVHPQQASLMRAPDSVAEFTDMSLLDLNRSASTPDPTNQPVIVMKKLKKKKNKNQQPTTPLPLRPPPSDPPPSDPPPSNPPIHRSVSPFGGAAAAAAAVYDITATPLLKVHGVRTGTLSFNNAGTKYKSFYSIQAQGGADECTAVPYIRLPQVEAFSRPSLRSALMSKLYSHFVSETDEGWGVRQPGLLLSVSGDAAGSINLIPKVSSQHPAARRAPTSCEQHRRTFTGILGGGRMNDVCLAVHNI